MSIKLKSHSFIETLCRAKYPLSVVDYICTHIPGKKLLGYDIGCAFKKTIANSSVGPKFEGRCTMNAMHGWSHIRPCQCDNHPLYLDHVGLSNMEDSNVPLASQI